MELCATTDCTTSGFSILFISEIKCAEIKRFGQRKMILFYFMFLLVMPQVFGQKTPDIIQNLDPKDEDGEVSHKKEIITLHAHPGVEKDAGVLSEKKVDKSPPIVELKPLTPVEKKQSSALNAPPTLKNRRAKWIKKQIKRNKKKNKWRQKQLRQKLLNRKKQLMRRNKSRNQAKKQMRNLESGKLSEMINLIMAHHKNGEGSKVSTQYIQQQVLDLLKSQNDIKPVTKPIKDCPKPTIKKRKSRKLLRRLQKDGRRSRLRSTVSRGSQSVSISKDIGSGKDVTSKIEKTFKKGKGRPKSKKGKVKSRVTIKFGRKRKPKKMRRKTSKKNKLKKN